MTADASDRPPDPALLAQARRAQRVEHTEHLVYLRLARMERNPQNRATLERIAADERRHAEMFTRITGVEPRCDHLRLWFYVLVARLFGLTFGLKLMEKGEEGAQISYGELARQWPMIGEIRADEARHEQELLDMLHDERLTYVGSVVLGLNDALVELTGALAGLTFAFQNTQLIALSGLVTGIAASFSMAASEYLSTRAEGGMNAAKASLYTGIAYIATVTILVLPYLLLQDYLLCLALTLTAAVVIILVFTFYVAIARDLPFWTRFGEMAGISLGVAALSFGVGVLVKKALGVEI
jgi:VIT1/CCC1 family predicted Fe2+/Mn2+ transporter